MRHPERLRLANLPTPIVRLERTSEELGRDIHVWRDDLTGFVEGGNKIRKLEFVLAEALRVRANHIVTCGGPQSNHARATAWLARRLGLSVSLVVRRPKTGSMPAPQANLLLDAIAGARVTVVPCEEYVACGSVYTPFLEREAAALREEGLKPFVVPEGASCPLGAFGYIHGVEEMLSTWPRAVPGSVAPDALVCALGSGGTHAGLYLGLELQGISPERLYAVNVCDDRGYFEKRVSRLIEDTRREFSLSAPETPAPLQILDGYVGDGYSLATDEELRFYAELARKDGLLLDPCYTGKAFRGMIAELRTNPDRFGRKILFLHSGGALATFAYATDYARALGLLAQGV